MASDKARRTGMPLLLQQASVEIKYKRGIVYLDRCGSLMQRLEDTLGEPWEAKLPTIERAELRSDVERLVVQVGPTAMLAAQSWINSAARVENVAPICWGDVAEHLGVGRTVIRCGVRFWFVYAVESVEDGEERLHRSGLIQETNVWTTLFGAPSRRMQLGVFEHDERGTLRTSISTNEFKVEGGLPPADLVDKVPKTAIILDMDHIHPGKDQFALGRGQLKDFIRTSWQTAREAAIKTARLLELETAQ